MEDQQLPVGLPKSAIRVAFYLLMAWFLLEWASDYRLAAHRHLFGALPAGALIGAALAVVWKQQEWRGATTGAILVLFKGLF